MLAHAEEGDSTVAADGGLTMRGIQHATAAVRVALTLIDEVGRAVGSSAAELT